MEQNNLDFTVNLADLEAGGNTPNKTPTRAPLVPSSVNPELVQSTQSSQQHKSNSACSILTVEYWAGYFDVTQEEIINKVKAGINPATNDFQELIDHKVDLYGPFWISTTLIFAMIVMPRLLQVLLFQSVSFDVGKIGFGFTLIYGGIAAFTFILFGISKFMGLPCQVFKSAAIYGYSYVVFLLVAASSIVPGSILHFVMCSAAGLHSLLFLLRNFKPALDKAEKQNKLAIMIFFALFQTFMTFMIYGHYL